MKPPAIDDREHLAGGEEPRRPARVVEAERLERARRAVPQVRADDHHAEHVEGDHQRVAEVLHLEPVEIAHAAAPFVLGPNLNALTWMTRNTSSHKPGDDHRRRGEASCGSARPAVLLLRVADRPRLLVAPGTSRRLVDVDQEDQQQPDLDDRQQRIADRACAQYSLKTSGPTKTSRLPAMWMIR